MSDHLKMTGRERARMMLRIASGRVKSEPVSRGERVAYRAVLVLFTVFGAWLAYRGNLVGIAIAVMVAMVAYSLAWAAWVCYRRPWLTRHGGPIVG